MIHYDLQSMMPLKNRRLVVFRPPPPSVRFEYSYRRLLLTSLKVLFDDIKTIIIPYAKKEFIDGITDQDQLDGLFSLIENRQGERRIEISLRLQDLLLRERNVYDDAYFRTMKSFTGIDLQGIVNNQDLDDILENRLSENVNLITSLDESVLTRVQSLVRETKVSGQSFSVLQDKIIHQFNVSKSRGRLIARDQVSKFTADINQTRQQQAGIKKYRWSTSKDERVRELHERLDTKIYTWGRRTGAEGGLPPGKPIQCRCVGLAIIEFKRVKEKGVKEGSAIPEAIGNEPDQRWLIERAKIHSVKPTTLLNALDFIPTDGGAHAAGFTSKNDCVIRSIRLITGSSYREIRRDFNAINTSLGRGLVGDAGVTPRAYIPYLERRGFQRIDVSDESLSMLDAYNRYGDVVVRTDGHTATIIDGVLYDSYNSESGTIVRAIYTKKPLPTKTVLPKSLPILNINAIREVKSIALRLPWSEINYQAKRLGINLQKLQKGESSIPVPDKPQMETKSRKWIRSVELGILLGP